MDASSAPAAGSEDDYSGSGESAAAVFETYVCRSSAACGRPHAGEIAEPASLRHVMRLEQHVQHAPRLHVARPKTLPPIVLHAVPLCYRPATTHCGTRCPEAWWRAGGCRSCSSRASCLRAAATACCCQAASGRASSSVMVQVVSECCENPQPLTHDVRGPHGAGLMD
jgi:hypothetical protein